MNKKKLVIVVIILLVAIFVGWVVFKRYFAKDKQGGLSILPQLKLTGQKTKPQKMVFCPLEGQQTPQTSTQYPLAIMIENHPDSRPQTGLGNASIIYEAITEGGITRFMAVYSCRGTAKVGPVRSARTFYLDWAAEFTALYSHIGGNLDALNQIQKDAGILDLDQFRYGSQAYWREPTPGKATEHTMYASTDKLWQIAQNNKWNLVSNFTTLLFKDEASPEQRPVSNTVTIDFSNPQYKVRWLYDAKTNLYRRELGGQNHIDKATGLTLQAKNIIVQFVERSPAVTEINEQGWAMKTVGEGKAKIFLDGKEYDGTWKKASVKARTKFFDPSGNELKFNPGVFWYEIVPPETKVTSS